MATRNNTKHASPNRILNKSCYFHVLYLRESSSDFAAAIFFPPTKFVIGCQITIRFKKNLILSSTVDEGFMPLLSLSKPPCTFSRIEYLPKYHHPVSHKRYLGKLRSLASPSCRKTLCCAGIYLWSCFASFLDKSQSTPRSIYPPGFPSFLEPIISAFPTSFRRVITGKGAFNT